MDPKSFLWLQIALSFFIGFTPLRIQADFKAIVHDVTDGDTVRVKMNNQTIRIRLIGIDAPEKEENDKALRDAEKTKQSLSKLLKAGENSKRHLQSLLKKGMEVRVENDKERWDRYGRTLGYLYVADGSMINEKMVLDGYAGTYSVKPNVRYKSRFDSALLKAKGKKEGLWHDNIILSSR